MAVKYGKFQLPTKIKMDEKENSNVFARFIAEPFERGYGHTLGNALRRILLISMEAPAIISVKIQDAPHEYTGMEGIIEDMTHIILNLKGALLRKLPSDEEVGSREPKLVSKEVEITHEMIHHSHGQYSVKLRDILGHTDFDIVNPDMHVFMVTKPMKKRVDLRVAINRGYVPSERQELAIKAPGEIVIDSCFSPVRLVNYYVENTRVGQDTDYDRLVLEVTTDGRVTPREALSFATQIAMLHLQVFEEIKLQNISFNEDLEEKDGDRDALLAKLALKIDEIELSVRSTNCLSQANIETIAELVVMPESDMLRFRNFGKKSLNEIKAKLEEKGLHLGMDLSRFGINKDNVKDVIKNYINETAGNEE